MKTQISMKSIVFAMAISAIIIGCASNSHVEIKNDSGKVVERYEANKDGLKIGSYESYTDEGVLLEKSNYKDGIQDGLRTIYYANGQAEIEENYQAGLLNGPYKAFYDTGELKIESNYSNNVLGGILKKYYKSGQIMEEVTFVNNEENGPFTEYWENGNLKWKGSFRNGDNEFGELLKYNEEGTVIRKLLCDSLAVCRTFWTIDGAENN